MTKFTKFQTKPETVEAFQAQWTGQIKLSDSLSVDVNEGDWVVKLADGQLTVYSKEDFAAKFTLPYFHENTIIKRCQELSEEQRKIVEIFDNFFSRMR